MSNVHCTLFATMSRVSKLLCGGCCPQRKTSPKEILHISSLSGTSSPNQLLFDECVASGPEGGQQLPTGHHGPNYLLSQHPGVGGTTSTPAQLAAMGGTSGLAAALDSGHGVVWPSTPFRRAQATGGPTPEPQICGRAAWLASKQQNILRKIM